ncbi:MULTISPECIES: tRNA (adenosine(37)-N6)-threonylcarbamoyltransferase complex ATPase subunit type 1 TsaE [unclassified Kaistella]|uniref:tRNA (adenosine(37)-N6)-threonylcarbamoyltransferase complex ATPase subunit type 1 TsaE n=1 Tax=unclassified Kaistella TaxID=2762626 RepID=UPI002737717C|nr:MULTISPECIES: tRNA (adenosine(37)-N6)-threonylcarbamoyltransferase complex ATPase subunit type 1 TsaE [unclassified Kaistella]MCZ2084177.1 tRNA (adenosine(37)-N6)-threonylcarbamoyltransferase complex ATPase subunit type 1 TsaE [Flavobacteriales bacterium]MDP2454055.1 tRNA (adenosine(37)-N6)-threonylcarbamoyltransferase complex ATPase subunit type 1 TsaE [Kaistella sp. SH11-4b]MDP2457112.1 tRNA (adenosine(37)-N6)-threonylcarbamoyltransferase complex ATPase subunit type 1 TsaE [Kaistella sp. SH
MEFKINKLEDWQTVIDKILPQLQHNILLLKGNLGAGKTTFSQFLLKNLGSQDEVSSPTYAIVNEYDTPKGNVFHFDLYRMKSADEVEDIGIHEYLDNAFLCIIEWPEVYEVELAHFPHHEMTIENEGDYRVINFH